MLNADGSLQEAGGIVWRDASGWNYGRNQDASLPEFNYVKDVDWISGASIAIPNKVWDENKGFDERYMPAYFDDSDIAFSLRAKGLRTVYSPMSALVHHEGITHGTDTAVGIKAYQVENKRKFAEKWQHVLESEHYLDGENVFYARDKSRDKIHILVVDHYVPQFDKDAGSRSIFDWCKMFADAGFQVSFWPDNLFYDRIYVRALQELGIEVLYGGQYVGKFEGWISKNGQYFEYALLSRPHVAQNYITFVREHSPAKILYFGHDLHFARLEKEYKVTGKEELIAEIEKWKKLEIDMCAQADVIMYPADDEVEYFRREMPEKPSRQITLYMYPNEAIRATREEVVKKPPAGSHSLIFVGGYRHRPNVDAAIWLVRRVVPIIKREYSDLTVVLVGSFPPPEVSSLAASDIIVTGYVSDPLLYQLYKSAAVAVAPLRFGGGVKGKIIEALRFGVPVVTTTAGTQGIAGSENFAEIGDTADKFAEGVLRLLKDSGLCKRRALAGLDFVERKYSYRSVVSQTSEDIPELARVLEEGGTLEW